MWQALLSSKYPVPESTAYLIKPGFRASEIDGYRVLSRLMNNGRYLTFCPKRIVHKLTKSEDWGTFVCDRDVDQKLPEHSADYTCPICFDEINDERDTFLGICGHMFHRSCVLHAWKKHEINGCAVCRLRFPESEFYDDVPRDKDETDWMRLKSNFHKYRIGARSTRSTPR